MSDDGIAGLLEFLRTAERLKTNTRSAWTSAGTPESVAEHTWRLCLMALVLAPRFPDVDAARLVAMCLIHDLGEAMSGDVPAPEQARRAAAGEPSKSAEERHGLELILKPLPSETRLHILQLWEEYEAAETLEARLAKALDKLETILQHTQGANPPEFDYRFNLAYGRTHTAGPQLIAQLRSELDAETERLARLYQDDNAG